MAALKRSESWELNIPFTGVVLVDLSERKSDKEGIGSDKARAKKGDAGDALAELGKYPKRAEKKLEGKQEITIEKAEVPRGEFKQLVSEYNPDEYVRINVTTGETNPFHSLPASGDASEFKGFQDQDIVRRSAFDSSVSRLRKADLGENPSQDAVQRFNDRIQQSRQEPVPPKGEVVYQSIPLLPYVQYTAPLLFLVVTMWLAWRVVNMPAFADFLIATEAEMNKVSWTTRPRLIQDTIVVLITLVLFAAFFFTTDQVVRVLLTWLGVLKLGGGASGTGAGDSPLW